MNGKSSTPHIAIIGCGISGLRCADHLLQKRCRVTILEARDRIGGRIHQIETGGHLVDLGANWIHEPRDNPILELAKLSSTVTLERPAQQATFDRYGKRCDNEVAVRLKKTLWDLAAQAEERSLHHWVDIDPQDSIFHWVQKEATERYPDEPYFRDALIDEAQRLGQFHGDPASTLSLKFACMEEGPGGKDLFMASTYNGVLALLEERISGKCVIRLNTEVVHINGRTGSDAGVRLTLTDGSEESFDEVVVSCPLGWLKKMKETAFSPRLPPRLSEAIENVSYGRLEKLYITFPTAFWKTDGVSPLPEYPCFTHFHSPVYGVFPSDLPANAIVISLAHLPDKHAHPTLLFYLHGPCGAKIVQSLEGLEVHSSTYNQTIDAFARSYYSLLPNFTSNTRPLSWFCSTWQNDPFAGNGSYSNLQVGMKDAYGDVEALQSGCRFGEEQGVWLSGEHTASPCRMGTTTGAYGSGERVARRICERRRL